ncbi:response regulator transcription factor [Actinomadura viridis]|uniref:Two-component system response regulator DesR n=1 Tax=Actinomadura viridis TaxID=58110 RepID=A0A931DNF6_9ACTN|nr:response regulator transcription factor [Actinomadura viridis]MBG6090811.1 two-component system response regulator DesR [Actinomadura viridis]
MIRILIAEEIPLVRSGLVATLGEVRGIEVVAALGTGERVAALGRGLRPDVALIDVGLPGVDGFTLSGALREVLPECSSLLMASRCRPGDLRRAAEVRAAGLLLKDTSPARLVTVIRRVARGERVIDPDLAFTELGAARNPLTERELEVLRMASRGDSAAQIAQSLVLTIGTVRNHLSRINRKIGARNRVHAIRIAEEAGWL